MLSTPFVANDTGQLSDSRQVFSWVGDLPSIEDVGPIARRSPVHFPTCRLCEQLDSRTHYANSCEQHACAGTLRGDNASGGRITRK
jgi:hypothetical protein